MVQKQEVNMEKNIPGFSTELYKSSDEPGIKERTILMMIKDHENAIRRMDQYYQDNIMATTEDIDNLLKNGTEGENTIEDHDDYIIDNDGVPRKVPPGEKYSIFADSTNNDKDFSPRHRPNNNNTESKNTPNSNNNTPSSSLAKPTEMLFKGQRTSYLSVLAAEKKRKQQQENNKNPKNPVKLAPEEEYEKNRNYLNEPKIVSRDHKIKVVFPGEEEDNDLNKEPLDFLQNFIRNQKIALKGDYMKEYNKCQAQFKEDTQQKLHPSGITVYEGAKTFLSSFINGNTGRMKFLLCILLKLRLTFIIFFHVVAFKSNFLITYEILKKIKRFLIQIIVFFFPGKYHFNFMISGNNFWFV